MFKAPPRGPFCYSTRSGGSPQLLRTKARREPAKGRKSHLGQNLVVGVFPMVSAPARLPPTNLWDFPPRCSRKSTRGSLRKENSCLKPPHAGLFATVLYPWRKPHSTNSQLDPPGYWGEPSRPGSFWGGPPMVSGVARSSQSTLEEALGRKIRV